MIEAELKRKGDRYVILVPSELVERYALREGEAVSLQIAPIAPGPSPRPAFREILDRAVASMNAGSGHPAES